MYLCFICTKLPNRPLPNILLSLRSAVTVEEQSILGRGCAHGLQYSSRQSTQVNRTRVLCTRAECVRLSGEGNIFAQILASKGEQAS